MIKLKKNAQTNGRTAGKMEERKDRQKDRQTRFYRTLPTTAVGSKSVMLN